MKNLQSSDFHRIEKMAFVSDMSLLQLPVTAANSVIAVPE